MTPLKEPRELTPRVQTNFPVPEIAETEVLVKIESAGLNPVDFKIVGGYGNSWKYPLVLGSDGAGVIAAVGNKVTNHAIGDRVFFQGNIGDSRTSTFQQYAAVPSNLVYRLPGNVSFDEGATFGLAGMTSAVPLYKSLKITPPWKSQGKEDYTGKFILIWGGTTNVGHITIQLAKKSGFTIIATASPRHRDKLKSIGATHVIDYNCQRTRWLRFLPSPTTTSHLQLILSAGQSAQIAFDALSKTKAASLVLLVSSPNELSSNTVNEFPNRTADWVYGTSFGNIELAQEFWSYFVGLLENQQLLPLTTDVIGGLDQLNDGMDRHSKGYVSYSKLVVRPSSFVLLWVFRNCDARQRHHNERRDIQTLNEWTPASFYCLGDIIEEILVVGE
ncbi:chaperonin 10-like protein [Obelidium mucronatum]|nr:chaperonin 10-like protein [Obelidium mucronatum]